jgi:hypothetical protein
MNNVDVWAQIIFWIDYHPTFFLLKSTCKTIQMACKIQEKRFGTREIRIRPTLLDIIFYGKKYKNECLFQRKYVCVNKASSTFILETELYRNNLTFFYPEKYTRKLVNKCAPFSFVADKRKKINNLNLFSSCLPKEIVLGVDKYFNRINFDRDGKITSVQRKDEEDKLTGITLTTWAKDGNIIMIRTQNHGHILLLEFPFQNVAFHFRIYSPFISYVTINGQKLGLDSKNQKKIKSATSDPIFLLALDLIKPCNHCYLGVKRYDPEICFECGKELGQTYIVDKDIKFHIFCSLRSHEF